MSAAAQVGIKTQSTFTRWLKFNFVGGMGVALQFAVLFLLKGEFPLHYLWATVIAVEAALIHNFVWHEQFTWADRMNPAWSTQIRLRSSIRRLLRFNLANGAVSIVGNVALMRVMVGEGHMNYLAANGIAIVLCSVANFVVSDAWAFGE